MSDKLKRIQYYKLEGKNVVPVEGNSIEEWAKTFDRKNRHVAYNELVTGDGTKIQVSTVFLGFDHGHFPEEGVQLFETMIFGGESDELQLRYSTWEEAEKSHNEFINGVF